MSHEVPFIELQQSLASDVAAISTFLDQFMIFVKQVTQRFDGADDEIDIELALREAIANAIIHGNHESPNKVVHVTCRCNMEGEIALTVRDEGEGFASRAVPNPTDPNNWLRIHGRGIYLMRELMDEVEFQENGTVVQMRKKL